MNELLIALYNAGFEDELRCFEVAILEDPIHKRAYDLGREHYRQGFMDYYTDEEILNLINGK